MAVESRPPRTNHLELAQRILDVAGRRELRPGARLPEQQLATACNVSRTPVRAALRLLQQRGVVHWEAAAGFSLAVDPAAAGTVAAPLPAAPEEELAESILADRSALRLDATVAVGALARRYGADRRTVLIALKRLADENLIERAPGQSWVFRPSVDGREGLTESYEFRLLLEPAAIRSAGFRLDAAAAAALRREMEALLALPDPRFDLREFQRTDAAFHGLVAGGAANRFLAEALAAHLRLRRLPGAVAGVNVFRLRQATREHLGILDQLEARQFEVAADLMRVHLRLSRGQRPNAANRGAPALFGAIGRPERM